MPLAPTGVSFNEVIQAFIDDIGKMIDEGEPTRDSNGESICLFLDVVGFIADYEEVSKVTDCMGHNANLPCSYCTFSHKVRHKSAT